jgi:hypothetical protein
MSRIKRKATDALPPPRPDPDTATPDGVQTRRRVETAMQRQWARPDASPCATYHTVWALVFSWLPRKEGFLMRSVCRHWEMHAKSSLFVRRNTTEKLLLLPVKRDPLDRCLFRPSFYKPEWEHRRTQYRPAPIRGAERESYELYQSLLQVRSDIPLPWASCFAHVRVLALYLGVRVPWNSQVGFFDGLAHLPALKEVTFACVTPFTQTEPRFRGLTHWQQFPPTLHTIRMSGWCIPNTATLRFPAYPVGVTRIIYDSIQKIPGKHVYLPFPLKDGPDQRVSILQQPTQLMRSINRLLMGWSFKNADGIANSEQFAIKLVENAVGCNLPLDSPQVDWTDVAWVTLHFIIRNFPDKCASIMAAATPATKTIIRSTLTNARASIFVQEQYELYNDAQKAALATLESEGPQAPHTPQ